MGSMSKAKGARGERELSEFLRTNFGMVARRGQQFSGSPDSPDIVTSIENVHIECKRTENLSTYMALKQAERDAGEKIPCVFHRKNRSDWITIIASKHLPSFCAAFLRAYNDKFVQAKTDGISAEAIQQNDKATE